MATSSPPIATTTPIVKTIDQAISETAEKYQVSEVVMRNVIKCESGFDPSVQSRHIDKKGKREESYGLVQINLPHNPDVTKDQALDPFFSLDFLGRRLSEKKGYLWTCHRMIYGV